jgi:hypothetical protein
MVNRHYSARHYKDGRNVKLFVGPGEKMVLLTADSMALFVWRKFISDDGQEGINCAVFRNEGPELSSSLILEAEQLAWQRWPGERFYTYVNPRKIKSANPGYCFKMAGWSVCGKSKRGFVILEKYPSMRLPTPLALGQMAGASVTGLLSQPEDLPANELVATPAAICQ